MCARSLQSCSTLCDPMDCSLFCPWDSLGKNTGEGCHALLQGIFLTQGSNLHLSHLGHRQAVYLLLVPPGKPYFSLVQTKVFNIFYFGQSNLIFFLKCWLQLFKLISWQHKWVITSSTRFWVCVTTTFSKLWPKYQYTSSEIIRAGKKVVAHGKGLLIFIISFYFQPLKK